MNTSIDGKKILSHKKYLPELHESVEHVDTDLGL